MPLCRRTVSSGEGVDDDLCRRVVNCLLRFASRSFWTDNRSRERRGLVGGVRGGDNVVKVLLFTSEPFPRESMVLPPLQQRPSSEGGGDGGALANEKGTPRIVSAIAVFSDFFLLCGTCMEYFDMFFLVRHSELTFSFQLRASKYINLVAVISFLNRPTGCAAYGIMKRHFPSIQQREKCSA